MKKFNFLFWGAIASFLISGIATKIIIDLTTTADSLLQALAVSIVLIIFVTRVIVPKFQEKSSKFLYFLEFLPLSLFVYLLVFSTGGLTSPFLILTHLFGIGMAFLISPRVSIAYVILTIYFIASDLISDLDSIAALDQNLFSSSLYLMAYVAVMPFSIYIAKIYERKEIWVRQLSQMVVTSKQQEENLLKNIEDPVIIITKDLSISFINSAAGEKTEWQKKQLVGKKIFDIFKFKDSTGQNIPAAKLPFTTVISTKNEAVLNNLQINLKNGDFIRVNLKTMPVIDHSGEVLGLILILKDFSQKDLTLGSYYDKVAQKLTQESQSKIAAVARDLLLLLSLESGIEGISQFMNLSDIVENEVYNLQKANLKNAPKIIIGKNTSEILGPRGKIISPQKHGAVQTVYILGNQNLLKVAVSYILKIAASLSPKESELHVNLETETDIVKLELLFNNQLSQDKLDLLFQKFFNEFLNLGELADFTGLEIAIAKEIFEKHGGDLKIKQTETGLLFSATLIRHEAAGQAIGTETKT